MSPPPDAEKLFPKETPDVPAGTFELGLVLGGTVSAGAYTAGALDFLTEALEAWHSQPPPPHRVLLRAAAGSSGGAVCAAILGLLSSRPGKHIHGSFADLVAANPDVPTGNPLWDLWVNAFQINKLLSTGDIDAKRDVDAGTNVQGVPLQHVPALVNTDAIDAAGQTLAAMGSTPGQVLPYFAQPFRVAVTVANLRGVPYRIAGIPAIGTYTGAAYVEHDDFIWFAFPNGANPATERRPDEFWLVEGAPDLAGGYADYATLVQWATASGSMPLGLVARSLSRPTTHYLYRPSARAIPDPPYFNVDWPVPDWSEFADVQDGVFSFTAVDGGTFNNDPVTLMHRHLAGLIGHDPRGKSDATRAILMIDPLADQPTQITPTGRSMRAVAAELVPAVIASSRYLTADMALFADENVFSRFQLVPHRTGPDLVGSAALSGSSLFAAAGWCAREFRVHDYLLGRANMQAYLRTELVLTGDNPLFNGWTDDLRADFAMDVDGKRVVPGADREKYFLPILPDRTGGPLALPPWPARAFDPAALKRPLQARLDAVAGTLVADNIGAGVLPWLGEQVLIPGAASWLAGLVVSAFAAELQQAKLWP